MMLTVLVRRVGNGGDYGHFRLGLGRSARSRRWFNRCGLNTLEHGRKQRYGANQQQ
jgi:hypothetical protein